MLLHDLSYWEYTYDHVIVSASLLFEFIDMITIEG